MIQFRFNKMDIKKLMNQFGYYWHSDYKMSQEENWNSNLTRIVDSIDNWCQSSGIKSFGIGYTQIELCVTFSERKDAMLFKLRWHNAQTTGDGSFVL